jgi:hypothetical protein
MARPLGRQPSQDLSPARLSSGDRLTSLFDVRPLWLSYRAKFGDRYPGGQMRVRAAACIAVAASGALGGLFYYVAREEQAIRRDPVKRTSDILRKVFGG